MTTAGPTVVLLTRAGCHTCVAAFERLVAVCSEFGVTPTSTDVDEVAKTMPDLRAEYGDRVPVVLLDGREHSYWEVDEPRLRADLAARRAP
ncbi:glutaredoxin family protein [Rhodococcus sp. RS1C4]|uniref:glutaredoxin family protein n=1 Tax=Nocardiaceae TaxID=85025 RepID=UPI000475565F|nr:MULTISPECIES: glutaredoxin family protein [Rhodococcus]OZC48376.1 glutaredoxin family protein [Rhodococcus sp. 06-621-2]OZC51833.1 glutaredoxin family protein [Rhodococcus sp. RS1C4]OZC86938.1 glutaredoxin family protein [Rhodococcus sp. 06-418-1B]OZD15379.1 glutaredoxin family protein [Rhodococcus sp. 06-156-4C]OZD20205.1 glutaredoxin family protein [Rhodococcus sp. 06-156-4a]